MRLFDQHLHSLHSFDSKADPAEVCRTAIEHGLSGITFTEHFDTHPSEWDGCLFDYHRIIADHARLREEFGDRLYVGTGIEVCYQPERMEFILDFLARHRFDLVLLSVHWSGGKPIHRKESWEGASPVEGTRAYLRTVLDAARFCAGLAQGQSSPFNVLGHLDFVKRYTVRWWGVDCVSECREEVDGILSACLEAGLIPEINASTLRKDMDDAMPASWVVRRYAELGGSCMSIGSDAHRPSEVGVYLDVAAGMIRDAGLEGTAVFQDQSRHIESVIAE